MNSNGKYGMKRILSMVLVITMMMTIMPFVQQPVHAASTIANPTVKNAVLNYLSLTEADLPKDEVYVIDISNDKSVIGTLDLDELKADFPDLLIVNIENTNITDVIGTAPGVTVEKSGTFADTSRKLTHSSSSITYNLETDSNGINLNDLIAALEVNVSDGTSASDLIKSLKGCKIDSISVIPTSDGTAYGKILHADLPGMGTHTLELEFEFKNVTTTSTTWTHTVKYDLNIVDSALTLTPSSGIAYKGGSITFKLEKYDYAGNPVAVDATNLTISTGLSAASSYTTTPQGKALLITVQINVSESTGNYTLTVADNSTGKSATAGIEVDILPTIASGTAGLFEKNGNSAPSGTAFDTNNSTMYIKGGTSISSEDIDNIATTPGSTPYTESTVYLLKDSNGDPIPDAYCSVLKVTDMTGNVTGEIISVGGYAAVRITGNATDTNLSGTFDISATSSSIFAPITITYSVVSSLPKSYKVYMIDSNVYSPSSADIYALINSTSDPAVEEIAEYTGDNIDIGWDPIVGNTATMLEKKDAWFVVASQYGNGEPYFALPYDALSSWQEILQSGGMQGEITTPPYTFVGGSSITGETVSTGGINATKALIVSPDNGSGGEEVTVLIQVSLGAGVSNTFELNIKVQPRSVIGYEIRTASGSMPITGDLNIPIGTSKVYQIYAVYDNGQKEVVDFAATSLDVTFSNSTLFSTSTATLSSGNQFTVAATDDGGPNDSIVGQTSTLTVKDSAGKTGTAKLTIAHSQINGLTYYVETPSDIYDYDTGDEIKKIFNESELTNTRSGILEIPRGLEANVWAVPIFTNTTMYDANDPADWQQYGVTTGIVFSSTGASGSGLTSPGTSGNAYVLSTSGNLQIDINEPLSADFKINNSISSNGISHDLFNGIAVETGFTVKITDPVVIKVQPEIWDGSTYTPLTSSLSGNYQLSGKVGDEIILRLRVTYSDGTSVDAIGNNSADTYRDGVYFLPSDTVTSYDPLAGYTTSPADIPLSDFGNGTDASLGVLHGYLMSHYPASYSALVNPISGIPSDLNWNNGETDETVLQGILSGLTKQIGIHTYEGTIATTKITADYLMKNNDVVPGHFVIKLTQSGTYTIDFSGTYTANGFNKKIEIEDSTIDLNVSPPVIEKVYLVSDQLSYISTTITTSPPSVTDLYEFDITDTKTFKVYPIFLDSSYRLTSDYATHGSFPEYLPTTSSAGTVQGVNKVTRNDWVGDVIGSLMSANSGILKVVEQTDNDGYIYFEVTVQQSALISINLPAHLSLTLDLSLGQKSTLSGPGYDLTTPPSNPNEMDIYTVIEPLLQDIKVGTGWTGTSVTAPATSVELGKPIYFPVQYLFNDDTTPRNLIPSQYPGKPGITNVLVVTPDQANPGVPSDCTYVMDDITGALKFTATEFGEYTFYLSSTNFNGAPIPAKTQVRKITFTVGVPNYTYDIYYGESIAISSLPSGYKDIVEVGTSYLDSAALESGRLKMLSNENGTADVEIRNASGKVIANLHVTLKKCDTKISLRPSQLTTLYTFAATESVTIQWRTEYIIPGTSVVTIYEDSDVIASQFAYTANTDFLTFSNSVLIANKIPSESPGPWYGIYTATDIEGTSHRISAKLDMKKTLPQYDYVLHDSNGSNPNVITSLSLIRGQVKNVYVFDTISNAYVDSFNVSSDSANAAVTNLGEYARIEGVLAGSATITFAPHIGGTPVTLDVTVSENIPQTYTVSGQITRSDTNAGIPATVTLTGLSGTITATTDANGNYTITGLIDGQYTLAASATGYISATRSTPVVVNGSNVSGENFALAPEQVLTYTVSGTITERGTANGIDNAIVTLSDSLGGLIDTTTTLSDGSYSFTIEVPNGTYTVEASATGYDPNSDDITVNNAHYTDADIELELTQSPPDTYTISGKVTKDGTGNPIDGATVKLYDALGDEIDTATTDINGEYSFLTPVIDGIYTIVASADTYITGTEEYTVAGAHVTDADIALVPETAPGVYTISGTISDSSTGLGISGATVNIYNNGVPVATAETALNGTYSVSVLNGTYKVEASKDGYNTNSSNVTVNNEDVTVNISLTPSVTPPIPPTPTASASLTITPNVIICGASGTAKVTTSNFGSGVTYTWSSSNTAIAAVSGSGSTVSVTGTGYGTATIYCTVSDGVNSIKLTTTIQVTYTGDSGIIGGGFFPVSPITPGYATYTVTFDSQGGSSVAKITGIKLGSTITAPAAPVREGYTFTGWYTESKCETKWNFSKDTVNKDITLYAGWEKETSVSMTYTVSFESNGGSRVEPITNIPHGSTISAPAEPTRKGYTFAGWYTEPVYQNKWDFSKNTVTENKTLYASWTKTETHNAYIFGYGNGKFGPNDTITRAQAAQIFYNLLKDHGDTRSSFSDVAKDAWYYDAVTVLSGLGIASGYADGTFKPNEAITREDFAVMAARFAGLAQKSGATGFTDVPETHKSAGYIKAAVEAGYIFGYGDGTFGPDRSITRAETVTIVNRMLARYADKNYIDAHASSLNPFTDVTKDHWAYYQILEAAITHNCIKSEQTENWTD